MNERVHHLGQRRVRSGAEPHAQQPGCGRSFSVCDALLDGGDDLLGLGVFLGIAGIVMLRDARSTPASRIPD